jgi:hypothetical protein
MVASMHPWIQIGCVPNFGAVWRELNLKSNYQNQDESIPRNERKEQKGKK